jgi:poly-gamma-glutamate synthesis protein (capsule biosynthesis protein)
MGRVLPPRLGLLLCGLCALGLAAAAVACGGTGGQPKAAPPPHPIHVADHGEADGHPSRPAGPRGTVTLAFAGDVHFQLHLAALLDHPHGALGPITRTLALADLTMVNLESSITQRGSRRPRSSSARASATTSAPLQPRSTF